MKKHKETLVIDLFGQEEAPFCKYPLPSLSPEETIFYLVYVLDAEVRNGGFYGYFGNLPVGGYLFGDLNAALERIGASRAAALVREACQVLFGSPLMPSNPAEVEKVIDAISEAQLDALSALDDRFYAEELAPFLYDFAEANQSGIRGAVAFFAAQNSPSLKDRFKGLFGR